MHLFVPVLTLVLVRRADFGARTWAGCALAFGAALVTAYAGADGNGGGAAGGGANGARMLGQLALIGYAFFFSLQRVRTQVHLRSYASEALNTARMLSMGALSFVPLLLDTALGGASRRTLKRLAYVLPAQWGLMALSVFLSAFVTSSLMFNAYTVISAANAQPFTALQMPFAALWSLLLIKEPISISAIAGGSLMLVATLLACTDKKTGAK
jgi:drug/metabolite transporter (DMT)-like permease